MLSHSAGYMCQDFRSGIQLDSETRIRQRLRHGAFDFECFFLVLLRHKVPPENYKNGISHHVSWWMTWFWSREAILRHAAIFYEDHGFLTRWPRFL